MDEAEMTAKVAAMSSDERWARLLELCDGDDASDAVFLEIAKLVFGSEAQLAEES